MGDPLMLTPITMSKPGFARLRVIGEPDSGRVPVVVGFHPSGSSCAWRTRTCACATPGR